MENEEAIAEFLGYMRSIDWQTSEMVRTFRGLVTSLDVLNESVGRIASAVEEIRNLKNIDR